MLLLVTNGNDHIVLKNVPFDKMTPVKGKKILFKVAFEVKLPFI